MTPAEVLKREQAKAKRESLELALLQQIRASKLMEPTLQHRFHPTRQWRFDIAWFSNKPGGIAVEVDGGTWSGGRHTRGAGFEADCEKLNEAALLGWRVLRVTGAHIKSGQAIAWIKKVIDPPSA
jgi:hypothetical protein